MRRKWRPPVRPKMIEAAYYGSLRDMLDTSRAIVERSLMPHLGTLVEATAGVHHDARVPTHRINRAIRQAQDAFVRRFPLRRITSNVEKIGTRVSDHHKRELKKQLAFTGLAVSLDHVASRKLKPHIRHFVADNVALIQDLPRKYLSQVQDVVLTGVREGQRASTMAAEIQERARVSKSRARLIARDQVGEILRRLEQAASNRSWNLNQFIWRTSEDERVRESHAELDGGTF